MNEEQLELKIAVLKLTSQTLLTTTLYNIVVHTANSHMICGKEMKTKGHRHMFKNSWVGTFVVPLICTSKALLTGKRNSFVLDIQ